MRIFSVVLLMLSLAWAPASIGQTYPYQVPSQPQSGTIASGGTFQQWLPAQSSRVGCTLENPTTATEVMYVFVIARGQTLASASTATSYSISAGGFFNCSINGIVITDAIAIEAATTSHAFIGNLQVPQ